LIRPFAGLRPLPEYTSQVIAPPYDVLNTEEARIRVNKRPWSFLHIKAVYAAYNVQEPVRKNLIERIHTIC